MTVRGLCLSAAILALAGACATTETASLAGEPGYVAGFGDGCVTAQEEAKSFSTKRVRDEYQFDNDRGYRAGWRQGYQECQSPFRKPDDGGRVLGNERQF